MIPINGQTRSRSDWISWSDHSNILNFVKHLLFIKALLKFSLRFGRLLRTSWIMVCRWPLKPFFWTSRLAVVLSSAGIVLWINAIPVWYLIRFFLGIRIPDILTGLACKPKVFSIGIYGSFLVVTDSGITGYGYYMGFDHPGCWNQTSRSVVIFSGNISKAIEKLFTTF